MADFWEALLQSDAERSQRQQSTLDAAAAPIDFGALLSAGAEGAGEALTDPSTYLESAAMLPGARIWQKLPDGGRMLASPSVGPARNSQPNWVWGEAGKGGRGWRYGAEGPPTGGGTNQVRALPQGGGGLPAVQGGLPAVQGGLPATQGGLPAVMGNRLPVPYAGPTGASTGGSAGAAMPGWLKALTAGTAGMTGYNMMDGENEPPMPPQPLYQPSGDMSQPSGLDINELIAMALQDEGGIRGVDFSTLPQVDYEGLPDVDREKALADFSETAPEAPAERDWTQDLGGWVIPALAGGLLGGIPGLLLGGVMGEGRRRTDEQLTEEEYQEAMNSFQRGRAELELGLAGDERAEALGVQRGQRQDAQGDYNFERGQKNDALAESRFLDTRKSNRLANIQAALGIGNTAQTMEYRDQLMNTPAQTKPADVFSQLINTAPGVYNILQNDPAFQQYQTASQMDDDITAQIAMSDMIARLSQDPQYGPLVQQIQQQMQQQQMMQYLQ